MLRSLSCCISIKGRKQMFCLVSMLDTGCEYVMVMRRYNVVLLYDEVNIAQRKQRVEWIMA